VRMTKPNSHHLTTGTFNYVVKDPNCFRLSGQLWIKDQPGRSRVRVLELDGAVFSSYCLLMASISCRLSIISFVLWAKLNILL
jgi:hypothetical protein